MNPVFSYLHYFFFTVYPYICMAVFLMGSLARFDRDQYTWKSDSSQMLRTGTLRWGSNLFHIGILFLFFGHLVGLLTPHWFYEGFISAAAKQRMAACRSAARSRFSSATSSTRRESLRWSTRRSCTNYISSIAASAMLALRNSVATSSTTTVMGFLLVSGIPLR